MSPQEFAALRETQRRLGEQQDEMREAQERFAEDLLNNTKETLRIGRSLEENTVVTQRVGETASRIEQDTRDLVDAFKTAVKVYRFFDWLRKFAKDWAWLPAVAIATLGSIKGWWKQLWP